MGPAPARESAALAAEEAALMARVADGGPSAPIGHLYHRYAPRLYGLGVRLLGDRGMAEELVQETFVRLWRAAPGFDPAKGTVRTYVFTIARRAAVDMLRRPAYRRAGPMPDEAELESEADALGGEQFEELLLSLEVRDAMRSLSHKHREMLELTFEQDLSQREIAERLQIPIGTVKTRNYYALQALRAELEERGVR